MATDWPEETVSADILIIGGGIAACCAAIEAAKFGVKVVLADKGRLGMSGSTPTSGGGAAFTDPDEGDDPDRFFEDTYLGGEEIGDPVLVRLLCEEVGSGVELLEKMGILFQKKESGRFYHRRSLGHRYPRSCSAIGDGPGLMIGLRKEVLHRGVTVYEDLAITGLIADGEVSGAYGIHLKSQSAIRFQVKAIVICAGSATDLYPVASANFLTTGDSLALAYEAGAELANLEFVEFTIIPASRGVPISAGGATPFPGQGARLFNSQGERFMERYDSENLERTKRSTLVRAVFCENLEGRGPVMMDASFIPPEQRGPIGHADFILKLRAVGVDPWVERFEWVPSVHTLLGGIVIDRDGSATVPGLFAAGEAVTGIHGANRLSGNAIGEGIVFGFRAGRTAALWALDRQDHQHKRKVGNSQRERGLVKQREKIREHLGRPVTDAPALRKRIHATAQEQVGIRRDGEGLQAAAAQFEAIAEELGRAGAGDLKGACRLIELYNLSVVGELAAKAAYLRQETRGQHWRTEFENTEEVWKRWIVAVRGDEEDVLEMKKIGYLHLA